MTENPFDPNESVLDKLIGVASNLPAQPEPSATLKWAREAYNKLNRTPYYHRPDKEEAEQLLAAAPPEVKQ